MSGGYESYLIKLLIPIAKYCLRRGLRIQQLLEAAKVALINAAEQDIQKRNTEVNVSKLAVATGLHRRDVMRLWRDEKPPKLEENLLTKIVGLWQHDKRFVDTKGKPKLLSYEGKESQFVDLVSSITQDINSYTLLFELERAKMVEKTEKGLKLLRQVYKPSGNQDAGMGLLSEDIDSLISAVDENIHQTESTPHLHIKTEYDNIPVEYLQKVKDWILDQGDEFHASMRKFLSQYDRDINPEISGTGRIKVIVGAFSFVTREGGNVHE